MRRGDRRKAGAAGFTLLEVIVSLVIVAAGLMGLMEVLSGGLRLAGGARDVSAAAVYASQRMEEALLSPVAGEGEESGPFGEKYRWVLKTTFPPSDEDSPFRPVRIEVSVRWNDGGSVRSVDLAATRWERRDQGAGG